jgi:hypothetical protein
MTWHHDTPIEMYRRNNRETGAANCVTMHLVFCGLGQDEVADPPHAVHVVVVNLCVKPPSAGDAHSQHSSMTHDPSRGVPLPSKTQETEGSKPTTSDHATAGQKARQRVQHTAERR